MLLFIHRPGHSLGHSILQFWGIFLYDFRDIVICIEKDMPGFCPLPAAEPLKPLDFPK